MAKSTKPEEARAESTEEQTVTLPKEKLDELLADMALMKSKLAGDERRLSADERKRAEEEAELERIREANERAEELVTIHVEAGSIRGKKNIEVAINGVQYVVARGRDVKVPRKVAEVIDNHLKQREFAFGLQDRKAAEFERQFYVQTA